MKDIYKLKARENLTLKQTIQRLELKASESTLSRRLKAYCLETGEPYHKVKCGRKKIKLTIKN